MRFALAVITVGLLAASAAAQPWYARGEFNGWSTDTPMTQDPMDAVHWTADVTGLFDFERYEWKIALADWSINMPASNSVVYSNAAGEIKFHLYDQTSWSDGWLPNNLRRVGYDDHQLFDWQLMGSFNGWTGDSAYYLTDMGNGLHRGVFTFSTPGIYDYKFRRQDDWGVSIGNDFGNAAGNNQFAVTAAGQEWTFELDLPRGRFRAFPSTPPTLEGDYNEDGRVDAADYPIWRKNPGSFGGQQGYDDWRANFGSGAAPPQWLLRGPQIPDTPLVPQGGGLYTLDLTGLTPEADYDLRVFRSDLSASAPSGDAKVRANSNGEIHVRFYELTDGSWNDGWNPDSAHRFGYVDHNLYDWEIVGEFNGWSGTNDPTYALTDQGNGVHSGAFAFATPGSYQFKFRQIAETNPWNTSIGTDFSNSAPNASFTVSNPGEIWRFILDLPNGRWLTFLDLPTGSVASVPEPTSLLLASLCAVAMVFAGRRRGRD